MQATFCAVRLHHFDLAKTIATTRAHNFLSMNVRAGSNVAEKCFRSGRCLLSERHKELPIFRQYLLVRKLLIR